MIIWIGIDDTDSRYGGCTTHIACVLIRKITDLGFDIIGFPRLVRLNPNIPWKTRGNGAISIRIGIGSGEKNRIGNIGGKNIFGYKKGFNTNDFDKIKNIIEEVIDKYSKLEDDNTNSGFVILKDQPDFNIYNKAVKHIIKINETKDFLKNENAIFKGYKNSRGLIGATSSIAWNSNSDRSFELITYREQEKWGSKRSVNDISIKKMDESISSTFDNFDYLNKHNRLTPSSPCPVLYGIRGNNYKELYDAKKIIESENIDSWIIFESNQGTDDHLIKKKIENVQIYESVIIDGFVSKAPWSIEGGHVFFKIKDETGEIDCAAYEPTKEFREIIRNLYIGDKIQVFGGLREKPLTVNLEKINVINLINKVEKIENPICPKCGKHMKSRGKDQGFKCIKCKTKSDKPKLENVKRQIHPGFYEVPVCARRHLSKPLKRYNQP
jgi:tRNA(Ile2)-agmatinylcytidine synthase